jgi:hypothetical protein
MRRPLDDKYGKRPRIVSFDGLRRRDNEDHGLQDASPL